MRRIAMAVIISAALAFPAAAAKVLPPEPAIEQTIQGQIDAFLVDDFAGAFTYASPTIRSIFGDADRFGAMVRNGFPMVWRPDDFRFLELRDIDGQLWQKVIIRDEFGAVHLLDYQMLQTDDGWRINGVQILRTPDVGA